MYGIDISKHQEGIDLSKGNYDFAIIKATEGLGYIDPYFHNYTVQLSKLDKLIGCYHFARPDFRPTVKGMEQEAQAFVDAVKKEGLLGEAILILDWETAPMNEPDLVKAWCLKVEELTDIVPFIYASLSNLNNWRNWWIVKHCPLWIAAWKSSIIYEVGDLLNEAFPSTNLPWEIWQFTSEGRYPGLKGRVDLNYSKLTPQMWREMARKREEQISDDMKWAIEIGLFIGYGDGEFRPKEALTREQAATLFRRFNDYLG